MRNLHFKEERPKKKTKIQNPNKVDKKKKQKKPKAKMRNAPAWLHVRLRETMPHKVTYSILSVEHIKMREILEGRSG